MGSPNVFTDKTVLIIGSSNESSDELGDIDLGSIDIVVRMNNSINVPLLKNDGSVFNRIDILSCSTYKESNIYKFVSPENLKVCNVKSILLAPYRDIDSIIKDQLNLLNIELFSIPEKIYSETLDKMNGFMPTTGFATLFYILRSNFKKLHIIGFTFFKTRYLKGYNSITDETMNYYVTKNRHNPELEISILKNEFKKCRDNICLGKQTSIALFTK